MLKNETLTNEERRHYLEIARKHTQRLGQLIGDLFELSKLDAHSIKPVLEIFSLAELLHDVSQEFELDAENKADEWVEFTGTFNSGDATTINLRCTASADFNGTAYWDNVVLRILP